MTEYTFRVSLSGITDLDCFKEASKDELKVLVAIMSLGARVITAEALAETLGVSRARVMAAIALFEEQGVLNKTEGILSELEYEFEPKNEKTVGDAGRVARTIRQSELHDMILDFEQLLQKTLTTTEVERLTSLHTEKALSVEYVLMLASFVKERYRVLTVNRVVSEATKLIVKGIDTLEQLEVYIIEKSKEIAGEAEMRSITGTYGRSFSPTERKYIKKWLHEYGYGKPIIGEAYDICVAATNKISYSYMDAILTTWHDAGCTTLEECRAKVEMRKYEKSKNVNKNSQKSKKNVEAETPKYADFNSEDALMRALERSYSEPDEG